MILYNVTVSVDRVVETVWVDWMKNIHIPEVMATGYFSKNRMLKLLNDSPDATGPTYAIQYELNSIGQLDEYLQNDAVALRNKHTQMFGEKCIAFRTVLEEV